MPPTVCVAGGPPDTTPRAIRVAEESYHSSFGTAAVCGDGTS